MKEELPDKQAWEVDFPIRQLEAQHVSRREFAKFLCVLSGGFCIGSAWLAVKDRLWKKTLPTGSFRICGTEDLPIGGMKSFIIPESSVPYILIRLGQDEWRIFEQKCTHLSCSVFYRKESGKIECPCHAGFFDARTGQVLQGPPPRPLPQLEVELRDQSVFAKPPVV